MNPLNTVRTLCLKSDSTLDIPCNLKTPYQTAGSDITRFSEQCTFLQTAAAGGKYYKTGIKNVIKNAG